MIETLILLSVATVALLGSPGPAPLALAACGASFGVRASLPFLAGILTGLTLVTGLVLAGLGTVISQYPHLAWGMQVLATLWFLYIAWRILFAAPNVNHQAELPSFKSGVIFNLINPKAYLAMMALMSQFLLPAEQLWLSYSLTALVLLILAVFIDGFWLLAGGALQALLTNSSSAFVIRLIIVCGMLMAALSSLILAS